MTTTEQLQEWMGRACALSKEAGQLFVAARRDGFDINTKEGIDLVTEVDKASEKLIIGGLKESYPEHTFVGEETSGLGGDLAGAYVFGDQPTWFIDPLDGTTNFVTGQNDVVVSIALWTKGKAQLAIIFNPFVDELYTAIAGQGAFCNGVRIGVSHETALSKTVVMNNIGASRDDEFIANSMLRITKLLQAGVRGFRAGGSCAMNMAYVASSRLGCYFEVGFGGPWDVAAGYLLIVEAGGVTLAANGEPFVLYCGKGEVLCGNEQVCATVAATIAL